MPEGDTLFKTAATLRVALVGKAAWRVRTSVGAIANARLEGGRIESVETHGKNLFVHFAGGAAVRTHLMMTGSWHVYRPTEAWQKPAEKARLAIDVEDYVAVCFSAPVVELLTRAGVCALCASLGPDVLAPDFDVVDACARLRALGPVEIGEALLDQGALAGVGNIYKSETLFVCKVDPFARADALPEAALRGVVGRARTLMLANLTRDRRTTPAWPTYDLFWVYGRAAAPCYRCRSPVGRLLQGEHARVTYFCSSCQGVRVPGPPSLAKTSGEAFPRRRGEGYRRWRG